MTVVSRVLWGRLVLLALTACRPKAVAAADDAAPVVRQDTALERAWPRSPPERHSDPFIRSLLFMVGRATTQGFVELDGSGLSLHGWWRSLTFLAPYEPGVRHGIARLDPSDPSHDVVVHQFPPTTNVTAWETCAFMLIRSKQLVASTPAATVERAARETLVAKWASGDERPPMLPVPNEPREFSTAPTTPFTNVVSAESRMDAWVDDDQVFFVLTKPIAYVKFPACNWETWLRVSEVGP